jgi:hypothetical protein
VLGYGPMREVETKDIGASLYQLPKHLGRLTSRANGANYLGAAHVASLCVGQSKAIMGCVSLVAV